MSKPVKLDTLAYVPVGELVVPVPPLTNNGVLPTNVHACSLDEVRHAFGTGNPHPRRADLWTKFLSFVARVRWIGLFSAVYINESFTTDKGRSNTVLSIPDPPGDIDAVLELPSPSPAAFSILNNAGNRWVFDQRYVKTAFEVHLFLYWPGVPPNRDFVDFFQLVKRDEALDRGLPVGSRKGILRVQI